MVVLKEILREYEEGAPFSFYFGAACHGFTLKVFYVFEQTVTRIDNPILSTYLECTGKDPSISIVIRYAVLVGTYFRPSLKGSLSSTDGITLRGSESIQAELAPLAVPL